MRVIVATLPIIASVVLAQDLGALPDCARSCLAEFTTGGSIGNCRQLDAQCICSSDSFISGIACCLAKACDAADQKRAVDYAISFCSTQGVTDLPTAVSCATAASVSSTQTQTQAPTGISSSTEPSTTTGAPVSPSPSPSSGAVVGKPLMGSHVCAGLFAAMALL
ncbi:hypothetical protein F5Y17DRAFT_470733 [Xylariaceae sp. FL0594]|nr:hypothetical protein F5Y17DRAFT_470733 [Xylariaceae sp. FL0594]